jgi:hypothetical protein
VGGGGDWDKSETSILGIGCIHDFADLILVPLDGYIASKYITDRMRLPYVVKPGFYCMYLETTMKISGNQHETTMKLQ